MSNPLAPQRPGSTIGLLGGGQLARMLVLAGHPLGFRFMVLDPAPSAPAAQVGAHQLVANYSDNKALAIIAGQCDLVSYEFENVDADSVQWLEKRVNLPQGSELLRISQHRLKEKSALQDLDIPVTPFREIHNIEQLRKTQAEFGEVVLKAVSGGYDGKGQYVIRKPETIPEAFHALYQPGFPLIAEQLMKFERELSVIVTRNRFGEVSCFPVAENFHSQNVLIISRIPARISESVNASAIRIATRIAEGLRLVGVMGVELFYLNKGELRVNEIAPRPHNSGHFTQDACELSQFEQHLRAIANWPIGPVNLKSPVVMLNLLGDQFSMILEQLSHLPQEARLHLYGKHEINPGRKMGHLNILSKELNGLIEPLKRLNIWKPEELESMLA